MGREGLVCVCYMSVWYTIYTRLRFMLAHMCITRNQELQFNSLVVLYVSQKSVLATASMKELSTTVIV
jgi:hypothetical protein